MKTRLFAGTFLHHNNDVILIQRGMHKKISPGLWAGIGGHVEANEYNNPLSACIREITEETGLAPEDISELKLSYHATCKTKDTLDTIYYFTGNVKEKYPLVQTDEGVLYWVDKYKALDYPMAPHVKEFYTHWVQIRNTAGFIAVWWEVTAK
jgi:ADP-ribose pyrophosphatase